MDLEKNVFVDIDKARKGAPPKKESEQILDREGKIVSNFIKGEYDVNQFKEMLKSLPELGGVVTFNTLPEFISAIRYLIPGTKKQNEILEHENAHAVEALQRGYRDIQYRISFTRDVNNLFILKIIRTEIISIAVELNNSLLKNGSVPTPEELREDIVAILSAPKNMSNLSLSESDNKKLGK